MWNHRNRRRLQPPWTQFLADMSQAVPHTHISVVALHVAAVAVLVPVGSLQALPEVVPRQAAVQAETCRAAVLQMVSACTQTARGNFLCRNKNRAVLSGSVQQIPALLPWHGVGTRLASGHTRFRSDKQNTQLFWGQTWMSAKAASQWVRRFPRGWDVVTLRGNSPTDRGFHRFCCGAGKSRLSCNSFRLTDWVLNP